MFKSHFLTTILIYSMLSPVYQAIHHSSFCMAFIFPGTSLRWLGVHQANFHTSFKTQSKWHLLQEAAPDFPPVWVQHTLSLSPGAHTKPTLNSAYLQRKLTRQTMFFFEGRNRVLNTFRNPNVLSSGSISLLWLHLAGLSGHSSNSPPGFHSSPVCFQEPAREATGTVPPRPLASLASPLARSVAGIYALTPSHPAIRPGI